MNCWMSIRHLKLTQGSHKHARRRPWLGFLNSVFVFNQQLKITNCFLKCQLLLLCVELFLCFFRLGSITTMTSCCENEKPTTKAASYSAKYDDNSNDDSIIDASRPWSIVVGGDVALYTIAGGCSILKHKRTW